MRGTAHLRAKGQGRASPEGKREPTCSWPFLLYPLLPSLPPSSHALPTLLLSSDSDMAQKPTPSPVRPQEAAGHSRDLVSLPAGEGGLFGALGSQTRDATRTPAQAASVLLTVAPDEALPPWSGLRESARLIPRPLLTDVAGQHPARRPGCPSFPGASLQGPGGGGGGFAGLGVGEVTSKNLSG